MEPVPITTSPPPLLERSTTPSSPPSHYRTLIPPSPSRSASNPSPSSAMLSVRIVNADHYLSAPVPGIDPTNSVFRLARKMRLFTIRFYTVRGGRLCKRLRVSTLAVSWCILNFKRIYRVFLAITRRSNKSRWSDFMAPRPLAKRLYSTSTASFPTSTYLLRKISNDSLFPKLMRMTQMIPTNAHLSSYCWSEWPTRSIRP